MADNWVETTVGDLQRWSDEHGKVLDEPGARILLDLAQKEMGLSGPEELTPERLRELLLAVFPESVVAGREDVPTILEVLRRIVVRRLRQRRAREMEQRIGSCQRARMISVREEIAPHDLDAALLLEEREAFRPGPVEHPHTMPGARKRNRQVRADEAGAAYDRAGGHGPMVT